MPHDWMKTVQETEISIPSSHHARFCRSPGAAGRPATGGSARARARGESAARGVAAAQAGPHRMPDGPRLRRAALPVLSVAAALRSRHEVRWVGAASPQTRQRWPRTFARWAGEAARKPLLRSDGSSGGRSGRRTNGPGRRRAVCFTSYQDVTAGFSPPAEWGRRRTTSALRAVASQFRSRIGLSRSPPCRVARCARGS